MRHNLTNPGNEYYHVVFREHEGWTWKLWVHNSGVGLPDKVIFEGGGYRTELAALMSVEMIVKTMGVKSYRKTDINI